MLKNKIKSKGGFTLAETLLAVLIMVLVAGIVAGGIPAARNAYEKVVIASNAELLLSTTISALRNELGTAKDIVPDNNGTTITYFNETRGAASKIYLGTGPQTILLQRYVKLNGIGKDSDPVWLVSRSASTKQLYVTYDSVSYSETNGIITFKTLQVKNVNTGRTLTKVDQVSIRVLSA